MSLTEVFRAGCSCAARQVSVKRVCVCAVFGGHIYYRGYPSHGLESKQQHVQI